MGEDKSGTIELSDDATCDDVREAVKVWRHGASRVLPLALTFPMWITVNLLGEPNRSHLVPSGVF
ncbi:MAG: hypothetical protein R3B83_10750 [Nitrospirales bacterium]|nr:hypothetical protein [Nitrospirales bacterium]